MIPLIGVEVRRLLSRRLLKVLGLLAVAGFALAGVLLYINTDESDNARLVDLFDNMLGVGPLAIILSLVVGASFIGAEWHHRTITTALTWEPRRPRLIIAKLVAACAVIFLATLTFLALFAAAVVPTPLLKGSTTGADAEWLREGIGLALRISAVGTLAATAGLSIATIGRNTAAALGASFVYLGVLESVLRGWKPHWGPWLLGDNASVFITGGEGANHIGHTTLEAGAVVVGYSALMFVVAMMFFLRRDVN